MYNKAQRGTNTDVCRDQSSSWCMLYLRHQPFVCVWNIRRKSLLLDILEYLMNSCHLYCSCPLVTQDIKTDSCYLVAPLKDVI